MSLEEIKHDSVCIVATGPLKEDTSVVGHDLPGNDFTHGFGSKRIFEQARNKLLFKFLEIPVSPCDFLFEVLISDVKGVS